MLVVNKNEKEAGRERKRDREYMTTTAGTKFELTETYSYEEFASRVVPQRALRHLTVSSLTSQLIAPHTKILRDRIVIN